MDAKDCLGFRTTIDTFGSNMTDSQRMRKLRFDKQREQNLEDQRELVEYAEEAKRSVHERPRHPFNDEPAEEESNDEILH